MRSAVVLGGSSTVWSDLARAEELNGGPFEIVIAVNQAAVEYDGDLAAMCSFHAELLPHFADLRREAGRPDAGAFWTERGHYAPPGLPINFVEPWGGSSGLIAAQVGMLVADRVVLCGVPLEPSAEHFDRPGAWDDAIRHRKAWEDHADELRGKVRSMSGWTAAFLGEPTVDRLA